MNLRDLKMGQTRVVARGVLDFVKNRQGQPVDVIKDPTPSDLIQLKKEHRLGHFHENIRGLFRDDVVYVWSGDLEHMDAANGLGLGKWPNWMPFYYNNGAIEFRIGSGVPKKTFLASARKSLSLTRLVGDKIFDDRDDSI